MIWNDEKIAQWGNGGGVTPFDESLVNPASLDLRLGNQIRIPHEIWRDMSRAKMEQHIIDGTIDTLPRWSDPVEFSSWWLMPHDFVLCHSLEFVRIPVYASSILVLKSSWGRKGLNHSHSGWGDPGFGLMANNAKTDDGAQWTFELQNISPWPIRLLAGDRLIQQVMMEMTEEPVADYRSTGNYVYQAGPTVAKV